MPRWTEEEEAVLKEMWENPEITLEDMAKVLSDHSKEAIRKKGLGMKLGYLDVRRKPKIDYEYLRKLTEIVEG